jgi:uncharacterized delta-60 repeat protein
VLTLLTVMGLMAPRPAAAQGALLWQHSLNGTANSRDQASSMAVDTLGNVIAAGVLFNTGTSADFMVAKFAPDGALLWQRTIDGTANSGDQAYSVAVDNRDNVVAAGFTFNSGTSRDFTVAKFAPDGTLLWQQNVNGTANGNEEALSVAVDTLGNVVAAGFTTNADSGEDFTVVKFAPDGALLWQRTANGTANRGDEAWSVAADTLGNVVAAGYTTNADTGQDFAVAKFAADGTLLWQRTRNGTADGLDWAFRVAVDTLGNVVAAGYITNTDTGRDFTVAKFAPDGTLLWQRTGNGTANGNDGASSVAVDTVGNVVAAGYTRNTDTGPDFTVAKFAPDGTLLWQGIRNGSANSEDQALSVAMDTLGNVVAAGFITHADSGPNFTVAKFASDGTFLWQQSCSGTASRLDRAFRVAVDRLGNVVAAGYITNTGTGDDFTVAKFAP